MQDIITVKPSHNIHSKDSSKRIIDLSKYQALGPQSIFKYSDIRGVYPDQLDGDTVYKLVKAFLKLNPGNRYVVGYDMRHSSKILHAAVVQSVLEENCEIDSIGCVTFDNLGFVVGKDSYDGGIMITASHHSAQFNGIKFIKKKCLAQPILEVEETYNEIEADLHYLPLAEIKPSRELDTTPAYTQHLLSFAEGVTFSKLKIVVDVANGLVGKYVVDICRFHPSVELVPMYFEPHPDFPHHEPNPSTITNLLALQQRVKEEKADLGVAFDGDGDRVVFVDSEGEVVESYHMLSLLAEYFMQQNKGATVVYDLRQQMGIESIVRLTHGRGVVSKTGDNFVKQTMIQEEAIFGGETSSSHYYYRDSYYNASGLATLVTVLKIMTDTGESMQTLVKSYRERFFISGEKNFFMYDAARFPNLINRLKNEFPNGSFSDFDGLVIDFQDWRFSLRISYGEPFLRLNIEASSKEMLEQKYAALYNILEEFAFYSGEISNLYTLEMVNLTKHEKLEYLFDNLQFTWNTNKGNYLDQLYGTQWSRTQTPMDIIRQLDQPLLDQFYEANKYNIEESMRLQQTYLGNDTWFNRISNQNKTLQRLYHEPIVYFSLEFGIVDWLQVYSGGLGILAGDTIKEASDSGVPIVGVGLFYSQGYFNQRFSSDGWQIEDYTTQDQDDYPLETVKDENGITIVVDVKMGDKVVKVRAWRLKVGRRSLLLLDTNFVENSDPLDKMITYHLYGGDQDTRIKQEMVLAIGGYKILRALHIQPSILHLNEGHSAFALIAQAQEIMHTKGMNFKDAIVQSRKNIIFTNHTLKQAGNDVFPYGLVEKYFATYAADMGVDFREIFSLGVDPIYAEGRFGMTILGLNNAAKVAAVSQIHAQAALKVWPDHPMEPITNGVHLSTWVSEPIHELFDEYVSEDWNGQGVSQVDWNRVMHIPNDKVWNNHLKAKRALIEQIKQNTGNEVSPDGLILSWFRRITAYKQPEVLMLDLDRLEKMLNDNHANGRPIYFVFGGKAHPNDNHGKEILKKLYQATQQDRFKGKMIIIPDYNWRMARYMVSGSDVWVNTPVRYQEACGTSGMKAAANGLIQFSTIDGWIDEVKDTGMVWEISDSLNANQYFSQIENVIIPTFWNRDANNIPQEWVEKMKLTMKIAIQQYGSNRMIREYVERLYLPLLKSN